MHKAHTATGTTLFITKKFWLHWFKKNQRLWYDWHVSKKAIHTPFFIVAYRPNILSLKVKNDITNNTA